MLTPIAKYAEEFGVTEHGAIALLRLVRDDVAMCVVRADTSELAWDDAEDAEAIRGMRAVVERVGRLKVEDHPVKVQRAIAAVRELLKNGPVPAKDAKNYVASKGVASGIVAARHALGVVVYVPGGPAHGEGWKWEMVGWKHLNKTVAVT